MKFNLLMSLEISFAFFLKFLTESRICLCKLIVYTSKQFWKNESLVKSNPVKFYWN